MTPTTKTICQKNIVKMLDANDRGLSVETQKLIMSGACTFRELDGPTLTATDSCQHCGSCSCSKPIVKAAAPTDPRSPMQRVSAALRPKRTLDDEGGE